jgi:hypothetical protein
MTSHQTFFLRGASLIAPKNSVLATCDDVAAMMASMMRPRRLPLQLGTSLAHKGEAWAFQKMTVPGEST